MSIDLNKRKTLELLGVTGVIALAGCADVGEDGDGPEDPGDDPEDDGVGADDGEVGEDDELEDGDDEPEDQEMEGGRLTVQVMTTQGEPIEGATVVVTGGDLDGEEQTTDENGEVVYEGLQADTYEIEVEDEELGSAAGEIPVEEDSDLTRTFSLEDEEEEEEDDDDDDEDDEEEEEDDEEEDDDENDDQ